MKGSRKISVLMYKLLIEKGVDGFSVVELRDESLLIESGEGSDLDEARKKVYRQILRFEKNGWLRSEGSRQKKRYFQTELFKNIQQELTPKGGDVTPDVSSDYSVLKCERDAYKGDLEIVLGEIEECQSLSKRFPELESTLFPLLEQTRERSARLLGKVNLLTNVLRVLAEDGKEC